MSKPETPKRCGVCGSELQLNRVFAMPDSWVCVKAGCPAWRWDGEPVPSAPKSVDKNHAFQVDRVFYPVERNEMTGWELMGLLDHPADRELWQSGVGAPDRKISPDDVVEVRAGCRFYSAPKYINNSNHSEQPLNMVQPAPPAPKQHFVGQPVWEGDWPDDYLHENGNYVCMCADCGKSFMGHKRRVQCRVCAAPPAPKCDHARIDLSQPCDVCPPAPVSEPPIAPLMTLDAQAWAKEFLRIWSGRWAEVDEALMIGWFANAIMRGFDEATNRATAERDTLKAEVAAAHKQRAEEVMEHVRQNRILKAEVAELRARVESLEDMCLRFEEAHYGGAREWPKDIQREIAQEARSIRAAREAGKA